MKKAVSGAFATTALIVTVVTVVTYRRLTTIALPRKPNIILFLADDTGYADLHSFGHPYQEWGQIDRMVEEGMKFTQWLTAEGICSPSRASILTGRHAIRSGVYGRIRVFLPFSTGGLPKSEITLAEALRDVGYSTGMVGKWHLGTNENTSTDGSHLPVHHGFDYVGVNLPFTQYWGCVQGKAANETSQFCFLYDNTTIVEQPINLNTLTRRLVRDCKRFINRNKDGPFFFFFSFPQTHQAMFCDEQFCGRSIRGSYGDNVNEMAWAVGEILDEVKKLGIEKDTMALFLSDHGPSDFTCRDEGSAGVFRGGKGTTWEGGFRVPAAAWWPGTIPAGSINHDFVTSLDIFPTLLHLAGSGEYASSRNITTDGQLISKIVRKDSNYPVRDSFIYYCSDRIMAVRYKQYKIHYHTVRHGDAKMADPESSKICDHIIEDVMNEYDCYGSHVITWDPPLVFDILVDPEERLMLNTTTEEIQKALGRAKDLLEHHKKTIVPVSSEVDKPFSQELVPCCNPPKCTCNYHEDL